MEDVARRELASVEETVATVELAKLRTSGDERRGLKATNGVVNEQQTPKRGGGSGGGVRLDMRKMVVTRCT